MTIRISTRQQENKVVMTKLPRDEFVRFKEVCEKENKSINKKIRELINQEVNKEFGIFTTGKKRKFYLPFENKTIEMVEIEDEK